LYNTLLNSYVMWLLSETGLSLERLAGFLEVAEAGSIAAVAQRDPSRQALLSRQIKELESFFAVKLTRRAGRGIELTDAGRDLARRSREAFRLLEEYKDGYAGRKKQLRIGASGSVLEWLTIPALAKLKQENFELSIIGGRTMELAQQLEDGELDFAILRDSALTPRLTGEVIGTYGYRLWVPHKLLPKDAQGSIKLLAKIPMALSAGGTFRQKLGDELSARGIDLNVGVETTSFAQSLEAARTGRYAAILPEFAMTHLSEKQFLAYDLPELRFASRTLVLARRKQREDLSRVMKIIMKVIGK
jgi:DNA-binding transcriptional LysR family regulator